MKLIVGFVVILSGLILWNFNPFIGLTLIVAGEVIRLP